MAVTLLRPMNSWGKSGEFGEKPNIKIRIVLRVDEML